MRDGVPGRARSRRAEARMKLPEIRLNGNLGAWVAFFGFLGGAITVSVTAGLWIGGVNVKTGSVEKISRTVDSLSIVVQKQTLQINGLASTVSTLTGAMGDMSQGIDNVSGQVSGVRSATEKIRADMAAVATREWVKTQADEDHRRFMQGVKDLRTNTERLQAVEGELKERIERLEAVGKKVNKGRVR